MSYGTIIQSGSFVSTGANVTLSLRSDVDWLEVYNATAFIPANNTGNKFVWFRGMAANEGLLDYWNGAANAILRNTAVNLGVGGFTLIDSSASPLGISYAVTAGTNATQPVYSTATTTGLANGSIVRVVNTAHANLNGLDFTIDTLVANTSFRLANAISQAPGAIAGAAGTYRLVKYSPLYYPRARVIANITQAAAGVVTTLVDHGYTTGQSVRFSVPSDEGMIELDGVQATVTVINAGTFSINVDTTAFTAFTFPLLANVPCNYAIVKPVGEDSVVAPNVLADATLNTGYIGIQLAAGITSPAGQNNDVIYWVAGKSENL